MSALVLHGPTERSALPRWSASAVAVVLLHACVIALAARWVAQLDTTGTPIPPILVDLAPATAAPEMQPLDVAPGPAMQEAAALSQPDQPTPELKEELVPPTPLQDNPVVAVPPERKVENVKPEPRPVEKPKLRERVVRPPSQTQPAPRTTAAPRAEQRAAASASAVGSVSSAAAAASYAQRLVAHLQRFKQYPAASRAAGEQGVARVAFTVTRGGGVSGIRIAGSSGHAALDTETLAMVRRAQPLPPFPVEMTESSKPFVLPMSYFSR